MRTIVADLLAAHAFNSIGFTCTDNEEATMAGSGGATSAQLRGWNRELACKPEVA